MRKVWEFLKGKKSFIVAFLGFVLAGALGMGYISDEMAGTIAIILGSLFGVTIRYGIKTDVRNVVNDLSRTPQVNG
jgi:hypothetical protein